MQLSFIVPVFNVEQYLRKCVESLIRQDFSDYEIILVDDGSTDGSGELCDEIVRADALNEPHTLNDGKPLIKVIHQANGGLSTARNAGLKAATGEHVCFVDSDDYWQPNVLGGLMAQIERENLDVLRFDYRNVNEQYEVSDPNKYPHPIDLQTDVVPGEQYLNERIGYGCYAWQFIIRREIVPKFKDGIYFEDTEWTPRMLVRAKRVNATTTIVYNYLTRQGSITKKYDKEHIRKKNDSLMQVNFSLQRLLPMVKDGRWIKGCIADNVYSILNNVSAYDYTSTFEQINTIKVNHMLPLRGYKVRKMIMLRYKLINLSPRLYCWLRHARMTVLRK